eukprot:TRINITY_DN965_c0_g1_i1.p2 TRINITY_DN965_c0_g1~~TRINITY_DN965_c0_g1_i1.p2  ORF type:complete len:121 (+),score=32.77 TRINITY_DN965_c0_g1_i1:234-596(+)
MDGRNSTGLGFNKDDDPTEIAKHFCDRHRVDRGNHMPEIVAHLRKFADPIARAQRLEKEAIARKNAFKQLPSWKRDGFEMQTSSKPEVMRKKIEEFNRTLLQEKDPNAMTPKSTSIFNVQ